MNNSSKASVLGSEVTSQVCRIIDVPDDKLMASVASGKSKKNTNAPKKQPSNEFRVSAGSVDKRVALTVAPKTSARNESFFAEKVRNVLGDKIYSNNWEGSKQKFYGLLRSALGTTSGLIFPYTPTITCSTSVNYDAVPIMHSNISYNYYKNTDPITYSISDAVFTADTRENALHMLSALWFLIACTKCDFGEKASNPGLPPPILYLSAYDSLIDNIPVVISQVSYSLPKDAHYVNLLLNMTKDYEAGEGFCKIYNGIVPDSFVNFSDIGNIDKVLNKTSSATNNDIELSFWLPTKISFTISLKTQPNLLKTTKQFDLKSFKAGNMFKIKNPSFYAGTQQVIEAIPNETLGQLEPNKLQVCDTVVTKNVFSRAIPSGWTW